jgi:flagellar hook-associated protein 2
MSTAPVNISGIASNIDTNSIVEKMMQVEGVTLQRLQQKQKTAETNKGIFETLATKLGTLKTSVSALKTSSTFDATTATVGDATLLSATTDAAATAGTYDVTIVQRAKSTQLVGVSGVSTGTALNLSKKLNDTANNLSTAINGSLTNSNIGQIQITNGAESATIDYTLDTDTLQDVISRINASDAGVTARYDTLSDRIQVTSNTGGDTTLSVEDVSNSGNLASSFKLTAASAAQTVLGQYAKIKVEGYNLNNSGVAQDIQSADNVFSATETGITGLSLTIKADTGSTQATVVADTAGIRKQFDDFVTGYNDVLKYIASQSTKGSGKNAVVGAFTGDASVQSLARSLRSLATATVEDLPSDINYLRGIGIGTTSAASDLSVVDAARLSTVISEQGANLKTLLTNETDGIMARFDSLLKTATTSPTGLVKSKADQFTLSLKNIKSGITAQNNRLAAKEAGLRKQFASMERAIASLGAAGVSAMLSSL